MMTVENYDDTPYPDGSEASSPQDPSEIQGYFDGITDDHVFGWAFDPSHPETPVELHIVIDGEIATYIVADKSRADVLHALGLGTGFNGFYALLPPNVFDGREHLVEIMLAQTGQPLKGDSHTFQRTPEGVAFLNRKSATIEGWARNTPGVRIAFDNGEQIDVPCSRPVAGFPTGEKVGFRADIPASLQDNRWHTARTTFLNIDTVLDGGELVFRVRPPLIDVRITSIVDRRVFGTAVDMCQPKRAIELTIEVDGKAYGKVIANKLRAASLPASDKRVAGEFSFLLPPNADWLTLTETDGNTPGASSTWLIEHGCAVIARDRDPEAAPLDVDLAHLKTQGEARSALNRFIDAPGEHFDEVWYSLTYPDAARRVREGIFPDVLRHYAEEGVAAGLSPGPFFDERLARRKFPIIDEAIALGHLDNALSLFLLLHGDGHFICMSGIADGEVTSWDDEGDLRSRVFQLASAADPAGRKEDMPLSKQLISWPIPSFSKQLDPATSVYAAWLTRLQMDQKTDSTLISQELNARALIGRTGLSRAPLVSIIMPTFNRAFTIGEAIQSVLDQSYQNWELIISDDGSTDKTAAVVSQFSDPRVRYISFEKSNGAKTRNKGLSFARGEYIAYLDSDNIWHPVFLDVMLRTLLNETSRPFAYSGYLDTEIFGAKVVLHKMSLPAFNPIKLTEKNFIDLNTIVHHRNVYDWLGGFDEALSRLQDWDLVLRYASVFLPLFVPYALVYYRRNIGWGQVTNLFGDQNVGAIVNEKTALRIDSAHVRLSMDWLRRPRLLVVSTGVGNNTAAYAFAALSSRYSSIDLIVGDDEAPAVDHDEVRIFRIPVAKFTNPSFLLDFVSGLPHADAIITIGVSTDGCHHLGDHNPSCFQAVVKPEGIFLTDLTDRRLSFHIGTLPFEKRAREHLEPAMLPYMDDYCAVVFLIPGQPIKALVAQSAGKALTIFVAPNDPFADQWQVIRNGNISTLSNAGGSFVESLGRCLGVVAVGPKLENLSIGAYLFVMDRMGAGVTTFLNPSDGLSEQLRDVRSVLPINVQTYEWVVDKFMKIQSDVSGREAMKKRSEKAYRIVMHPELVQERIQFFLHHVTERCEANELTHVE